MSASHEGISVGALLLRAIQRGGDQIALVDGDRSLTYRELGRRAGSLAAAFEAMGLEPGAALAQLSKNSLEAAVVIVAAFLAGLRYTPLHPLSSVDDWAFIIDDAEIDCLVIDELNFRELTGQLKDKLKRPVRLVTHRPCEDGISLEAICAAHEPAPLQSRARAQDIALLIYTGGTTGRPKGVVHRHASLVTAIMIGLAEWDWPRDIRYVAATPVSHAALLMLLQALLKGGSVALLPRFAVEEFVAEVERTRATCTFLVPSMIYALLDHPEDCRHRLASLETIIYGAAAIDVARLQEALRVFGPIFAQLYGQTEAPNAVTMLFRRHHDIGDVDRLASCGHPLVNNDVRLLDDEGVEVPPGEVGEICVRGPLLMDGYWRRPDETADAMRFGWLHTGDLAIADHDGFLRIVDRKKDVVITGGFNVFSREVEDALASHPKVAQCCVVGVPHPKWGEQVSALVVARAGEQPPVEELLSHVARLKGSVATPKLVRFIDRLPTTALGKTDKAAARKLLANV